MAVHHVKKKGLLSRGDPETQFIGETAFTLRMLNINSETGGSDTVECNQPLTSQNTTKGQWYLDVLGARTGDPDVLNLTLTYCTSPPYVLRHPG